MMRTFRLCWLAALLLVLGACHTRLPEVARPETAPAAERHYRSFDDADALAAYLRAGSEAGILISAHRGGPMPGYPENALATFERALRFAPALIEADVRLTCDSVLVLMHDETLGRTTTGRGPVAEKTLAELRRLRLVGPRGAATPFRIPTLAEALAWAEGRAVLTLDVKPGVPPERTVAALRRHDAAGRAVVITYTLEDAERYHVLAPNLVLSVSVPTPEAARALFAGPLPTGRLIAFIGVAEHVRDVDPGLVQMLHARGIRVMLGTFGALDERALHRGPQVYEPLLRRGVDVLATDAVPVAAEAARRHVPAPAE